jgi:hypothetical protein
MQRSVNAGVKMHRPMHEVFVEGGLVRKLWSVETDAHREHLRRLDP